MFETWKFKLNLQALILILIIAILVAVIFFSYLNAGVTANDQKRIADTEQIQAALKIYYDENGFYPASNSGVPKDIETYLNFWPTAPAPDGSCTEQQNTYTYAQRPGMDYWLTFCLGEYYTDSKYNLSAGPHRASSKGIE